MLRLMPLVLRGAILGKLIAETGAARIGFIVPHYGSCVAAW
jgi:hypothetical protein